MQPIFFVNLIMALINLPVAFGSLPDSLRCANLTTRSIEPNRVFANGVKVTGESIYPLQTVLNNLNLTSSEIEQLKPKEVLLVAEGFSGLLPYFLKHGCLGVQAVDLWYHQTDIPHEGDGLRMREYIATHGRYLIQGDVFNLPFANDSKDAVLSHLLVHHFPEAYYEEMTLEMLRVLRPGGVARIYGYIGIPHHLIKKLLAMGHTVAHRTSIVTLHPDGKPLPWPLSLLKIGKHQTK